MKVLFIYENKYFEESLVVYLGLSICKVAPVYCSPPQPVCYCADCFFIHSIKI